MKQLILEEEDRGSFLPFRQGLLKWIGNKQKFAPQIISFFPLKFGTYFEPFVGSGGVLANLSPRRAVASDCFAPLMEIWQEFARDPNEIKRWYQERWEFFQEGERVEQYEKIKFSYNSRPNGEDLLFLSRSCYGGVVRFRKSDGYMSTPCGIHNPMKPENFNNRVDEWSYRLRGTRFHHADYSDLMIEAKAGDLIYCDPPYSDTQSILYGAQAFSLHKLLEAIGDCKRRGVYVALSIDGTKRSGNHDVKLEIPNGIFEREITIDCGRSMLKRFQMGGRTLESELITDRLLLTY